MQRVTTAIALLAIVIANVVYAPSMWRRMQRKGEAWTRRDLLVLSVLHAALITAAATVFWMMLNPRP